MGEYFFQGEQRAEHSAEFQHALEILIQHTPEDQIDWILGPISRTGSATNVGVDKMKLFLKDHGITKVDGRKIYEVADDLGKLWIEKTKYMVPELRKKV